MLPGSRLSNTMPQDDEQPKKANHGLMTQLVTLQVYNKDNERGGRKRGRNLTVTTNTKSKMRRVSSGSLTNTRACWQLPLPCLFLLPIRHPQRVSWDGPRLCGRGPP